MLGTDCHTAHFCFIPLTLCTANQELLSLLLPSSLLLHLERLGFCLVGFSCEPGMGQGTFAVQPSASRCYPVWAVPEGEVIRNASLKILKDQTEYALSSVTINLSLK